MESFFLIWYELYAKIELIAKLCMRRFWIFWDPDYLYTMFLELIFESSEVLCFESASWSVIFWIEIEESVLRFSEAIIEMSHLVEGEKVFYF